MMPDLLNVYSGTYPLAAGVSGPWAGQVLTTNTTTYSTNAIDHSSANSGFPSNLNQNIQVGLGDPLAVWLEVTAIGGATGTTTTYNAHLVTDSASNLTTTPVVLASVNIPYNTVVGTIFMMVIPPSLNFLRYSGIKYILADGNGTSALSVVCFLIPVNMIQSWVTYVSGWTIENS